MGKRLWVDLAGVDMAAEYLAGASLRELSELYGPAPAWFSRRLRKEGVPMREVGGRANRRTDITVAAVMELHQQGLMRKDIAARLGCSGMTVSARIREAADGVAKH